MQEWIAIYKWCVAEGITAAEVRAAIQAIIDAKKK